MADLKGGALSVGHKKRMRHWGEAPEKTGNQELF